MSAHLLHAALGHTKGLGLIFLMLLSFPGLGCLPCFATAGEMLVYSADSLNLQGKGTDPDKVLVPADSATVLRKDQVLPDSVALKETGKYALTDSALLRKRVAAQAASSQATKEKVEATAEKINDEASKPRGKNSKLALLYSIIPGGGQIYNGAYWKLPIIAGIYTACTYAITWNNTALTEYQNAYRDLMSEKPMENTSWQDFLPIGADPESYIANSTFQDQLRRGRDYYRRYRDLSIIITAGMYLLVMLDAYVDAELSNFDVSPNLSMQAAPAVLLPQSQLPVSKASSPGVGLSLAFNFAYK